MLFLQSIRFINILVMEVDGFTLCWREVRVNLELEAICFVRSFFHEFCPLPSLPQIITTQGVRIVLWGKTCHTKSSLAKRLDELLLMFNPLLDLMQLGLEG